MKKILALLTLTIVILTCFVACDNLKPQNPSPEHIHNFGEWEILKSATPTENGEKVRYCSCGENQSAVIYYTAQDNETVITVEDGYLVVNGVKTEYKVDADDKIEVIDGYLVVNGNKTEYQVKTEDVIEIIDGYVVVNGVKTDIFVPTCNHSWTTVTTEPTCKEGGYDTLTCSLCGKSVRENETAQLEHNFSTTYSYDDNNHWFKCTGCDMTKDKATHNPDDDNNCTACGTPLSATPGVIYDVSADGTYAEVVGYTGTATKVKIASEYNGLPVKNIYDNAFKSNTTITSVVIPDSVTSIGGSAFEYCSNLPSVVIPDSVTSIGSSAFKGCSSLTSVVIGDGITSITSYAFYSCSSLTSVVIPDSVTYIGDSAFTYCTALANVSIGNNVVTIGSGAFGACGSLTSIVIPDSVEVIEGEAFSGAYTGGSSSLHTVVFGKGLKSIGGSAFNYCYKLTSINLPDGVTSIGEWAFYYCYNLTSVVIPDSVTSIGNYAFSGCSKLQFNEYENCKYLGNENNPYLALISTTTNMSSYIIHDDTKVIADYAFNGCTRLTSIVIPDSVTTVGGHAFASCSDLKDVYYKGSAEEWNAIEILASMSNYYLTNATKHYNYVPEN